MEAIKHWLQDWSDACEYARECAPDLAAFPTPQGEPFTAIAAIAAIFFAVWAINEHRLAGRRAPSRQSTETGAAKLPANILASTGHQAAA
jgi:hypothetical protein